MRACFFWAGDGGVNDGSTRLERAHDMTRHSFSNTAATPQYFLHSTPMGGDYTAPSLQWVGQVHPELQACMHEQPGCRHAAVLEEKSDAPLSELNICLSDNLRALLQHCSADRSGK